jgi:hypothetical protein
MRVFSLSNGHHTTFSGLACKKPPAYILAAKPGTIAMKSFLKSAVLLTCGAAAISMAANAAKCDRAGLVQTVDAQSVANTVPV